MGFAAWTRWINELDNLRPILAKVDEHLAKFDADESAPFEIQLGNAWCYDSLVDARRCAVLYLNEIAGSTDNEASRYLKDGSEAYEKVVADLTQNTDCPSSIAPYPWTDEKWTAQMRSDQAKRLQKALIHERIAIEAIKAAIPFL